MTSRQPILLVSVIRALIICLLAIVSSSCERRPDPSPPSPPNPGDTGVALKPKDPTHKVVCSCVCGKFSLKYTFDVPLSGKCEDLDGTNCQDGPNSFSKLSDCEKFAVRIPGEPDLEEGALK
jgi:hypothetical protein